MELERISASSVNTFQTCPLQWQFNYLLKLLQLPNPNFIVGTAYHKCNEDFHNGRKVEQIIEEARVFLMPDKYPQQEQIDRFDMVTKMFKRYVNNPVKGDIIETESRFSLEIKGIGVPLVGVMDRKDTDKTLDYKTSSADYKPKDIDTIQSKIYTYARWREEGKLYPMCYSVNNKKKINSKKYVLQELTIEYTEKDMIDLEDELRDIYNQMITTKEFIHSRSFKCRWCAWGSKQLNSCEYSV